MSRSVANILVRPPTRPSDSARTIRQALGDVARISRIDPIPRQYRTVVNWGNPTSVSTRAIVLNKPENINNAINKLTSLRLLQGAGVRIPDFFTSPPQPTADRMYFVRRSLTGSGGVGIEVVRRGDSFPAAPLYTAYVKKQQEYRLHVFRDAVIFAQMKMRRSNSEQTNDQKLIRNYDNGWVFCPRPLDGLTEDAKHQAVEAVKSLGLDFGAVDLVIGRDNGQAYVLEINTAPGVESPGLIEAYKQAILGASG